jgi:2-methylcitrate dehydratase PrpD
VLDIPEGFIGQIAEPVDAKMAPRTPTHARASVFYAASVALAQGSLGMEDYSEAAIARPEILALARRMRYRTQPARFPIRFSGRIEVTCTNGDILTHDLDEADGTGGRTLSQQRLEDKFRTCAQIALPPDRVDTAIALCRRIETLSSIDGLLEAVA